MSYFIKFLQFVATLCVSYALPGQDHTDEQKKKAQTECVSYFNDSAQADSLKSRINIENLCDCLVEKVYAGYSEEELQRMEQKGFNKKIMLQIITKIKPCIVQELEEP